MNITFPSAAANDIDKAPKGVVRVRITEEPRGTKKIVLEDGVEWIEIGAGKASEMSLRKFRILCRAIIQAAKQFKMKRIATQFDKTPTLFKNLHDVTPEMISQIVGESYEMANFEFNTFRTKPKEGWQDVEEVIVHGKSSTPIEDAVRRGQMIGQAVNACRALANTPGGSMTPKQLAQAARDAAADANRAGTARVANAPARAKSAARASIVVTTLGKAQMGKLGMGALLGVASGSDNEPTFTIMEYNGGKKGEKPIVLAGKGITFDSGGLNLKPSAHIYEMHMDMSGAAAVIHTVALAAKLGIKKNVVGLIPSAENMTGGNAYRPGDILKSLSGKTIEVLNTDAEGRLVLADALTYAKRFNPGVVLDVATLTGAAVVALGLHASGLLTKDDALAEKLTALSETSGDYLWRLPMWEEYDDMVKGTFADLSNIGSGPNGRYGGATEGGIFLWQFAKELGAPWAHLDIAPRMTAAPGEELAKGAAGAPVRLLLSFIEQWQPS